VTNGVQHGAACSYRLNGTDELVQVSDLLLCSEAPEVSPRFKIGINLLSYLTQPRSYSLPSDQTASIRPHRIALARSGKKPLPLRLALVLHRTGILE
jgi:hypothetical protein